MNVKSLAVWVLLTGLTTAFPARAIECISSNANQKPILLFEGSRAEVNGSYLDGIEKELREKLNETGQFKAVLRDQYQYARQQGLIDKCTPVFNANVQLTIANSDPGQAWGLGGFVTKTDVRALVRMTILPGNVTLDEFEVNDKAKTFIAGKEAEKALYRLFDNLVAEFVKRKDGWVKNKVPGF